MKKLIFSLMMICMMVMSSGVVWADVMPIGGWPTHTFSDYVSSELALIATIIFVLWCVIGATLNFIKKQKEESSKCKELKLEKIYLTITAILFIITFFILKGALLFCFPSRDMLSRYKTTSSGILEYNIINLGIILWCLVKKDKKILYRYIHEILFINIGMILISLASETEPNITSMGIVLVSIILFVNYLISLFVKKLSKNKEINMKKNVAGLYLIRWFLIITCLVSIVILPFKVYAFCVILVICIYFGIEFIRNKISKIKKGEKENKK